MRPLATNPPERNAGDGSMTAPGGGLADTLAQIDWAWLAAALLLAACYLVGVGRLRRRGDRWPIGRTASWLLGSATIVAMTSGDLAHLGAVRLS